MFCGKCGGRLEPTARFCPSCGTQVVVSKHPSKKQGEKQSSSPIVIETNDQRFERIFGEGVLLPLILSLILAGIGYKVYGSTEATITGAVIGFLMPMLDKRVRKSFGEVMLYIILVVGSIALIIWLFLSDFFQL